MTMQKVLARHTMISIVLMLFLPEPTVWASADNSMRNCYGACQTDPGLYPCSERQYCHTSMVACLGCEQSCRRWRNRKEAHLCDLHCPGFDENCGPKPTTESAQHAIASTDHPGGIADGMNTTTTTVVLSSVSAVLIIGIGLFVGVVFYVRRRKSTGRNDHTPEAGNANTDTTGGDANTGSPNDVTTGSRNDVPSTNINHNNERTQNGVPQPANGLVSHGGYGNGTNGGDRRNGNQNDHGDGRYGNGTVDGGRRHGDQNDHGNGTNGGDRRNGNQIDHGDGRYGNGTDDGDRRYGDQNDHGNGTNGGDRRYGDQIDHGDGRHQNRGNNEHDHVTNASNSRSNGTTPVDHHGNDLPSRSGSIDLRQTREGEGINDDLIREQEQHLQRFASRPNVRDDEVAGVHAPLPATSQLHNGLGRPGDRASDTDRLVEQNSDTERPEEEEDEGIPLIVNEYRPSGRATNHEAHP